MKKMDIENYKKQVRTIQELDLEMILEVDRLCKKHHLKYFLAYGTLLGAIRHNGFIPWDDDADLFMPFEDYKRLQEITKTELSDKFRFEDIYSMPDNIVPWGKVLYKGKIEEDYPRQGLNVHHEISIDIFPLYHYSNKPGDIKRLGRKSLALFHILIGKVNWKNENKFKYWLSRLFSFVHFGSKTKYKKEFMNLLQSKEGVEYDYFIAPTCGTDQDKNIFPVKWFDQIVLHEFEGYNLPIPESYEAFLTMSYGEYMTLPPKDRRWNVNHKIIRLEL